MISLTTTGLSPRTEKLKERFLASPYEVDLERARFYTRAWREMGEEGKRKPCIRAARALEKTLSQMTIRIEDDERFVGVKSTKRRGEGFAAERGSFNPLFKILTDSRFGLEKARGGEMELPVGGISAKRSSELVASLRNERIGELRDDIFPYWSGRAFHDEKINRLKEAGLFGNRRGLGPVAVYRMQKALGGIGDLRKLIPSGIRGMLLRNPKALLLLPQFTKLSEEAIPESNYLLLDMQGHIVPGYGRILEVGFKGVAEMAEERLVEMKNDTGYTSTGDFLESVIISANAVCAYSERYAELAAEMMEGADGARREELAEIAERCRRVPSGSPRTFMEAVQSFWITQVVLAISYGVDNVFSPGRVDQYLYPYYKRDLEAGLTNREDALEAIEELLIKSANNLVFGPNNITIGGLDRQGQDATNELSHLFLEALENVGGMSNGLAVRISRETPRAFLLRALETHRVTAGVAFYNDDIVIRDLMEDGYSLEDARDYSIVGCVEPTSTGNNMSYTAGNVIHLVGVLEMALNRGHRLLYGGRRVGVNTPDPRSFTDFEDVKRAFSRQLSHTVAKLVRMAELKDRLFAEEFPSPLLSSTIEGCIESGRDITAGGATYNHGHVNAQALATVADSVAAIRWAVFEQKLLTMEELVHHLRNNFRGAEELRKKLSTRAPKYGNDDPAVDELAQWVAETFVAEVRKHRCWRGGVYRPSLFSSGTQDMEGMLCAATPDGRLAREVVSNGISPTNGAESKGMTAVFLSAVRGGKAIVSDGTALNMNLSPGILDSDENVDKLASMILSYFELGGRHVQFNPVDARTLRDAKAHPGKYPALTVKVSGYSACFVDLGESLQDDIIARTEFGEF